MLIYVNTFSQIRGGPHVWSNRFCHNLLKREFRVTAYIKAAWEAALFINNTEGLADALNTGKTVGYRVAGAYLPGWFEATGRTMKVEHHTANSSIARALQTANVVIYQSHWAKSVLDKYLYQRSDTYQIIYNGIDLNQFSPNPKPSFSPPVIGTVGSLRYLYRLETFFEMSRQLNIPHRLLIVGEMDEECKTVYRKIIDDPVQRDRITYQTQVPAHELPQYYRQMNLLIHPVCGDVCPNVVVEALACGIPVIAPRYGGTAELVEEAGGIFECQPWLYNQEFIHSLTETTLTSIGQLSLLSVKARQRALALLDIDHMVDQYLTALGLPLFSPEKEKKQFFVNWQIQIRQKGARLINKPRYYSALVLRKAWQLQRKMIPVRINAKPRIAFSLFDFHVGGIENWLFRLAKKLQRSFDFYFLSTKIPEFLPKFKEVGVTAFISNPAQMIDYLRKHNIDILQVHNERWPVDAGLAAGVPHIIERLGGQRSWRRVPKYGLEMVIASSQAAATAIADLLPPKKIRLVYNGIDLSEVDAAPCQRYYPDDKIIIGRTSRFGIGQNLELLIEAVAKLLPTYPQLRLVIVGGDSKVPGAQPVEENLHQLTTNFGLEQIVVFPGLVEDSIPYIKGFNIGTCVSNDEGIPNSLIEAMACSKPIISTKVGSITELIENQVNGLLIEPNDLDGLCEAISRLVIDDNLRHRLGEEGRRTIVNQFNIEISAKQYAEIYESLLAGKR